MERLKEKMLFELNSSDVGPMISMAEQQRILDAAAARERLEEEERRRRNAAPVLEGLSDGALARLHIASREVL